MPQHSEEFLKLTAEAKSRITQVSPDEALNLVNEGAVLLDVREEEEFAQSHLPGATNVARDSLEKITEIVPDKSTQIVCYCAGGNRGALAADTLQNMGYKNIVSIEGGMNACSLKS
jgi:phage shock protein E